MRRRQGVAGEKRGTFEFCCAAHDTLNLFSIRSVRKDRHHEDNMQNEIAAPRGQL